jgi:hypothetical protein
MPTFTEAQQMYCTAIGRPYPIPGFDFCCAFSAFRLGVITQGIAGRYYQKQNASPRAKVTSETWYVRLCERERQRGVNHSVFGPRQNHFHFAAALMKLAPMPAGLNLQINI